MNGKGSKPRNNHSARFRANFDEIHWLRRTGLNVCCGKKMRKVNDQMRDG